MKVPLVVNDFIERARLVYPQRVGVVDEPDTPSGLGDLTYDGMYRLARAQAAALDALQIGVGERVAVVSQNSARLLTSFYGVSGWGRVLVPINFRLNPAEISYIVEHSGASTLLFDPELRDVVEDIKVRHRFELGNSSDKDLYAFDVEPVEWQSDEDATATINYTSGTTSRPKGVQLTHRNLWINAAVFGLHTSINDADVYLHTLPLFHVNGWGMPFGITGVGGRHIIQRKVEGAEILRRVAAHGVTLMCCAPAVVASVLEAAQRWSGPTPGAGTTRVVVAGAPPPTRIIERVRAELGWEFLQIYGLTEVSPVLTVNRFRAEWRDLGPSEVAQRLSRAGAPTLGVSLAIDNDGEVLARGNVVMDGYWEQPEATSDAIGNGWFRTGDGGFLDEEGYLVISDRKKDVIITGGENVSSIEVEDALYSHPSVIEAAVIGVPDEKWGETIKALVVVQEPITENELIDHCRTKLAHYKCPRSIEFRESLPRTATGKLQKFKLREPYWSGLGRQVH